MTAQIAKPRWIRDLLRFLPLKNQFVLSGNVRDHFPLALAPGAVQVLPLVPYVCAKLRLAGEQHFSKTACPQRFGLPVFALPLKGSASIKQRVRSNRA